MNLSDRYCLWLCRWSVLFVVLFSVSYTTSDGQGFVNINDDSQINFAVLHDSYIGGGVAFFDFNNDNLLDVYFSGGQERDRIYRNEGDGTFTEIGLSAGLIATSQGYTHAVTPGDINNDGFTDILVSTFGSSLDNDLLAPNLLLLNNGNETFSDITVSSGIVSDSSWSAGAVMFDYNLDGYLDIYVTNYVEETDFLRDSLTNQINGFAHTCYSDLFYINNGDLTFTESVADYGLETFGCGLAVTATDFDQDNDPDLMVINDFGEWVVPNKLYRNEYPLDSFTEVSAETMTDIGLYGMGVATGDYNEDGLFDYYITNLGSNALLQGQPDGTFLDFAAAADVLNTEVDDKLATSWGAVFFDYDHDSYQDLFVANGWIPAAQFIATATEDPNQMYHNNGDGTFTEVTNDIGLNEPNIGRGIAIGDLDNDGDMDMAMSNLFKIVSDTVDPSVIIYRNDIGQDKNWVKVTAEGTINNRNGYGVKVWLHANGRHFLREIWGGSSHASTHEPVAHFGLDTISTIDSIEVIWPGGLREVMCDPDVNQTYHFVEGSGAFNCVSTSLEAPKQKESIMAVVPNPFHESTLIQIDLPQADRIRLEVFDVHGRRVALLADGQFGSGLQQFELSRQQLAVTGLYFIRLENAEMVQTVSVMFKE